METTATKTTTTIMLAVIVALVTAACGGTTTTPTNPAPSATAPPHGWSPAQKQRFVETYRAGEAQLLAEISPYAAANATPTSEEDLACTIGALESLYPSDADNIIDQMFIDAPDDTPGVADTLSDEVTFALIDCGKP